MSARIHDAAVHTSHVPSLKRALVPAPTPRSVLVIEDETLTALAITETLERDGYDVLGSTGDAQEALRLAAAKPDFAVVDIRLGDGGSGLEVGRLLACQGVTVLYATAYGVGFRQEMEDSGGRACLQKPFSVSDLSDALSALDELRRGELPQRVPPAFHLFLD